MMIAKGIYITLFAALLYMGLRADWLLGHHGRGFPVKVIIVVVIVGLCSLPALHSSEFAFGMVACLTVMGLVWLAQRAMSRAQERKRQREALLQRQEWDRQEREFRERERAYLQSLPKPKRFSKRERQRRKQIRRKQRE